MLVMSQGYGPRGIRITEELTHTVFNRAMVVITEKTSPENFLFGHIQAV